MRTETIAKVLNDNLPVEAAAKRIYGYLFTDNGPDEPFKNDDAIELRELCTRENYQHCEELLASIGDICKQRNNPIVVPSEFPVQTGFCLREREEAQRPTVCVHSLEEFEELEPEWLIPDYIPLGCVTLLVGDGGVGKGMLWTNLVAAITTGKNSVFDDAIGNPFSDGRVREHGSSVLILSQEDDVAHVLRRRLRSAGADAKKVRVVDNSDPAFSRLFFGSEDLHEAVRQASPKLVILDPIQAFMPEGAKLIDRGDVRRAMTALISLAAEFNCAVLVVVHTNKKSAVSGRQRMADSADIWDCARSVLLVGNTDKTGRTKYVSVEKHNYTDADPKTVLYGFEGGKVVFRGITEQRDRDFVSANTTVQRASVCRDEATRIVLDCLSDGKEHPSKDVRELAMANGVSEGTLNRALADLRRDGRIKNSRHGFGRGSTPFVRCTEMIGYDAKP